MIIDNKNMSDTEVMLGELDRIVSAELKKKDSERDDKLIDECIEEMAKLKNVRAGYTQEEIDTMFERIQAKASGTSDKTPVRRKSVRRSIAAACAACLVLVCGVATVAWNPFQIMYDWFYEVFEAPTGTITEGGITYTNHGAIVKYDSIEELLKNENLDIYYPAVLPDDIYITRIETMMINDQEYIIICFSDPTVKFTIQCNHSLNIDISEYETIKTNNITFYLYQRDDIYVTYGCIDSNLYMIECKNHENIIFIINSLIKG